MSEATVMVEERRRRLLQQVRNGGRVVAAEAALAFGVSEDSIRRDLRALAGAGLVQRVRGGALPAAPNEPFDIRSLRARPELAPLAAAVAARLAEIGGVVVLDAGVTNERVAAALDRDAGLTVVTAGPAIAAAALRVGVEVVLLGGVVDREIGAAVDATAVEALRGIRADAAVLGLCAVDADAGVTTARPAEVAFKRCLTAGAGEVIAAATADKLGTAAPYAVAPAAELTTIFALAPLPPGPALSLAERGVEVVEVGAVGQVGKVGAVGQVGKVGAVADPGRSVGR